MVFRICFLPISIYSFQLQYITLYIFKLYDSDVTHPNEKKTHIMRLPHDIINCTNNQANTGYRIQHLPY